MTDVDSTGTLPGLPWSATWEAFVEEADGTGADGACCLFAVAGDIPEGARNGYAALVIAYTRDGEPVTLLDDGSAVLLVRRGGPPAADVVAHRVLAELQRLHLDQTVRIVYTAVAGDAVAAIARLRSGTAGVEPGAPTPLA